MKIECTAKEIANLVTELQNRLIEFNCRLEIDDNEMENKSSIYFCDKAKNIECSYKKMCSLCDGTTTNKKYAKLDTCGNPLKVYYSAFQDIHSL